MLMVVLCVVLAIWLPYHREQVAIREIERLGGEVGSIWDGPKWITAGPEWMQEIVNDGWLSWIYQVQDVDLGRTAITDEGLKHLNGLTKLKYLDLSNTRVSDEGVKELQKALPDCDISY
jgi:hypothetical protein